MKIPHFVMPLIQTKKGVGVERKAHSCLSLQKRTPYCRKLFVAGRYSGRSKQAGASFHYMS